MPEDQDGRYGQVDANKQGMQTRQTVTRIALSTVSSEPMTAVDPLSLGALEGVRKMVSMTMSMLVRPAATFLLFTVSSACYRYVEVTRPLTPAECPPEPQHGTVQITRDPQQRARITGRVFDNDAATRTPLPNAAVRIDPLRRDVAVDSSGNFHIDSLSPGRYVVRSAHVGFYVRRDTIDLTSGTGVQLQIGLARAHVDGCPGFMGISERKRVWRWPWQRVPTH